jgi:hypothetical protein
VTIKYSSAGVPLWTNRYNGPGNGEDNVKDLAVDTRGNVYVTGGSKGTSTIFDYATVGYSSAGVPLWTNRYHGAGNDYNVATAIAVDTNGNVVVTGFVWGDPSGAGTTIKYAGVPPPPPVITNTVLAGTNLVFSGEGGSAGGTYYVVASTNVADPGTYWVRRATNLFGIRGAFSVTNTVSPAKPREYFRILIP